MRVLFLRAVVVAVILLGIVLVVQITTGLTVPLTEGEISYFNLLVDVAVGFFTIWGLYWAASELALKPDLRLIVGKDTDLYGDGVTPLLTGTDALLGQVARRQTYILCSGITSVGVEGSVSVVGVGLFLENTQPRAAQYVRVVLHVRGVPQVMTFAPVQSTFKYKPRVNAGRDEHGEFVFLQFDDDLVVYKGHGVYLGKVHVVWPQGVRPERITFVASLYSLDSEPKEVTISHPIRWTEETT